MDLTCQLGNVFSNAMRYLFEVRQTDINLIAGFDISTTPPFDSVAEIGTIFQNGSTAATSSFATTSITMNLGGGTSNSIPVFSATTIRQFIPDSIANTVKGLLLAGELFGFAYLVWIEIKSIFKTKTS